MKKILYFFIIFFSTFVFINKNTYGISVIDEIQPDQVNLKTIGITDTETTSQTTITGEHIKSFVSQITVRKDGKIDVKEIIVYDFSDLDRHGIYRDIPFTKKNLEGKLVKLDFDIQSVQDEKGKNYRYTLIWSSDQLRIKIGDPDRTITGVHTYVISYRVSGALTYFTDHDELYWNTTGTDWNVPIAKTYTVVELPNTISEKDVKTVCYTGSYGESSTACTSTQKENYVTINSTNLLFANQGLTAVIGFPKGKVAVLEPKIIVQFFDTFLGKIVKILIILLVTFWYIIYPIMIIYKWYKYGRDPKGTVGEVRAWYDPPRLKGDRPLDEKSNRFMTPAEVGTLGDETVDMKDISATIVDLARRGYLRIEEKKKNDFYFIKSKDIVGDTLLLSYEKKLLNGIFGSGNTIRIKDEELYGTVEEVKKELYENVVKEGLFPNNPQSVRTFYTVVGVFAFITGNFFLAVVAFIFGRNMPRKTIEGVNAYNVAKSLKNFLTSQERQLAFQADKQMMFEKLLPFAVAFGVEKIWAERFKDMNLKSPEWYQGYSGAAFNSVLFTRSLNSSMSSFSSAAHPPSSSSSGFSGGFSGGGGGGGGGGSW